MKRRLVSLPLALGAFLILWGIVHFPAEKVSAGPKLGYCVCVYPNGGSNGCFNCPAGANCASCTPSSCACDNVGD
jgi:hypothetical protein